MIHIFHAHTEEKHHNQLLQQALPYFPLDFQDQIIRYRRWQDAQASLLGRLLLNHGLRHLGIKDLNATDLAFTPYNKPFFKNQTIKFNISHSSHLVACVLSCHDDIGIDVELLRPIDTSDFRSQMTQGEWEKINTSEDHNISFFEYWTQKEAVIKAHGMGLSLPLTSFEVINGLAVIDGEEFPVKEIGLDKRYKCHIALRGEKAATTAYQAHSMDPLILCESFLSKNSL